MGNHHSRRVGASYYAADGWNSGPVTWGASPAHAYADAISTPSRGGTRPPSRYSSSCATPPVMKSRDWDEGCQNLRRSLGSAHKLCKYMPEHIEAWCRSIGKESAHSGPDAGLAAYIKNLDTSMKELYHLLTLDPRLLRRHCPVDVFEFSEVVGGLAIDLHKWCEDFRVLTAAKKNEDKARQRRRGLRAQAKSLRSRCWKVGGVVDSLCSLGEESTVGMGHVTRASRRTMSPVAESLSVVVSRPLSPVTNKQDSMNNSSTSQARSPGGQIEIPPRSDSVSPQPQGRGQWGLKAGSASKSNQHLVHGSGQSPAEEHAEVMHKSRPD
ncbi:hypothetical protein B0A52_00030 [Exophiala mesophila]|uniref:Uncharacterized protein n=1 Tax=Exophiala mesophila TaxID=212818 RepID=A0A438NIW1_EXOME|nr:hypothetical protein B0A52_00030 [Exophiala mesophila]